MARYKKATFIAIFGLGAVTCVISIMRISILSTMNFADITYSIPRANIFSGLEPCLAVILASVPMMRPLLGRSTYTPEVTACPSDRSSSASKRSRSTDDSEFQPLKDDSSELCLRPVGPKHEVGVAVVKFTDMRKQCCGGKTSLETEPIPAIDRKHNTIPWVTDAPDYFQGYGAKAIGAKDATTTYGINCLSDRTACHRFTPDLTVIYGPSTYDMVANGYKFDFTSGCTLMGSPAPTRASCTETKSSHENSAIDSATVLVPATGADSTLGVFPATLIVTDTGDFPAPTATETTASANSDVSTGDAILTTAPLTPTGNQVLPTPPPSSGLLNSTAITTGVPTYFGNGTSPANNHGATVTVTVLASSIPCHCECDCRQNQTARATVTVPLETKNDAVKTAAPVALCGVIAGAMFWI
ncbi:uncharacterized protein PGRI_014140 [Penicillium griseofulvum]|uniref:Rhodopsin domain-containing protein n=1 Tax=Penicillium patulum TaxID=5078 RepID=A0A135LEZ8_PENPA|nr:uncharacterized protein PGRI_014140 [Penicillium griseofulvum]KXG47544.1 hypothetical protein PGRI_014140 [Penicillium griseofulvum]